MITNGIRARIVTAVSSATVVAVLAAAGATLAASEAADACAAPVAPEPIEAARLYVEFNATDGDLGVHGSFDDSGWSSLCVLDPSGRVVLVVDPDSQLGDLTMASIFFESREPALGEFSFPDLASAFPEGAYAVRAVGFDGTALSGEAMFSHDVPAAPTIVAPALAPDEEAATDAIVPLADLTVSWEPVSTTVDGDPIDTTAYEVIITKVDHDDPDGLSRPILDVHVLPTIRSFLTPAGFLEPDTLYELEVLALEGSGNQTISIGFFTTAAA